MFDTSRRSRKFANLSAHDRVAVVIGWTDETTVQCEGVADVPEGEDHDGDSAPAGRRSARRGGRVPHPP